MSSDSDSDSSNNASNIHMHGSSSGGGDRGGVGDNGSTSGRSSSGRSSNAPVFDCIPIHPGRAPERCAYNVQVQEAVRKNSSTNQEVRDVIRTGFQNTNAMFTTFMKHQDQFMASLAAHQEMMPLPPLAPLIPPVDFNLGVSGVGTSTQPSDPGISTQLVEFPMLSFLLYYSENVIYGVSLVSADTSERTHPHAQRHDNLT
ncbi:hypothetical protein C8Q74DRAFT_1366165 [Fomes fomentarius]|nr:hypothetical protein C8Q74DRAFT_1366165 [Fomes fomentarius]